MSPVNTGDLFQQLHEGQMQILEELAKHTVMLESMTARQDKQEGEVNEIQEHVHHLQGAWKLIKLLAAVVGGGVAVTGGLLKIAGVL